MKSEMKIPRMKYFAILLGCWWEFSSIEAFYAVALKIMSLLLNKTGSEFMSQFMKFLFSLSSRTHIKFHHVVNKNNF
jgi:hypothetical protein